MEKYWEESLTLLRRQIQPSSFEKWFAAENSVVTAVEKRGRFVYVCVTDVWAKTTLTDLYGSQLQEALSTVLDEPVEMIVVDMSSERIPDAAEMKARPAPLTNVEPTFNPRYTFDSFVVGSSNRFAHAAAMAVAESPARSYNPLFIYGGSGLGKTHLMHAIGQAIREKKPKVKVVYASTEAFTNEFIYLLRENRLDAFKNRYRKTDILLIDDIQFLINKNQIQEEFFHTFNALHDAGKQIVISSDRPPKEINPLEERLRSRFEWGLITDIQPPDLETRCAILQQKAISEDMKLDDEVTWFIAERIQGNIRELEGALNKVIYFSRLTGRQLIDMNAAREALNGLLPREEAPKLTISLVQKVVADYYQITVDDLKSKKKDRFITYPRQIAMYLCREMIGATQPQIGRDFGNRDHTTVIHACDKIGQTRLTDSQLAHSLDEIETLLKKR